MMMVLVTLPPQTQTVQVDGIFPVPNIANLPTISDTCSVTVTTIPTATDGCTGVTITATTSDPLSYSTPGRYTITWLYDDGFGNTTSQTQNIEVNGTTPVPDLTNLPTITATCSLVVTTIPTATDGCTGATILATTSDPLTYTTVGTYTITWNYDDGFGNTTSQTQTLQVNGTSPVPDIPNLPMITGTCSLTVSSIPTATDTCTGAIIDATTFDPLIYTTPGFYSITWAYDDGNGNITIQPQIVRVDGIPPVPGIDSLPPIAGACSVTVTSIPRATDGCTGTTILATTSDPLTYSTPGTYTITWVYDDGTGNTTTQTQTVQVKGSTPIPNVMNLPTVTGTCTVTVDTIPTATDGCTGDTIMATTSDSLTYTTPGTYTITWFYDDGTGNTISQTQTVQVDASNPVPDLASLPTITDTCSVTVSSIPTATAGCIGVPITATTSDPLTYSTPGTFTITWIYDDGAGNTTSQTQTVQVDGSNPVPDLASLPIATDTCSVTVTSIPTASDACNGTEITATTSDPLTYSTPGTYMITWVYDDGAGNTTSQTQTVQVTSGTPIPDVPNLPVVTSSCAITVSSVPTATDACTGEIIRATTTDPLNYSDRGTYTISWFYDDGFGNTTSQTQTVQIDGGAPVPDLVNLPMIIDTCSAVISSTPTASDACTGASITATTSDPLSYATPGTYTVTWNYEDSLGNITSQTQDIQVLPNIVFDTVSLSEVQSIPVKRLLPLFQPQLIYALELRSRRTTNDSLTYDIPGTYTVNWNYNDGLGNVVYSATNGYCS